VNVNISTAGQDAANPLTSWHDEGARPRSLAFDVFGDYVRFNGDELSLRAMVELLKCFDVAEATTRIMMSRLRAAGAFYSRREGRETIYRLTAAGVEILEESRRRIFDRQQTQWSGAWSLVLYTVPENDRAARERLRRSLQWLGFGQLTAGTWISAHDRLADAQLALRGEGSVRLDRFRASSVSRENDRELAARCWDLEALNGRYQELVYLVSKRQPHYRRGLTDRDAFIARLRLVHKYRMSIYEDPNLPRELLPIGWIGNQAHAAFTETHDLLRPGAERYFLEIARGVA
jgi:phenylacetic acid degradation operon negative regulatory protein